MKKNRLVNYIPYMIVTLFLLILFNMNSTSSTKSLSYGELIKTIEEQKIEESVVTVGSNIVEVQGSYKAEQGNTIVFTSKIPATEEQIDNIIDLLSESNINIVDANSKSVWIDLLSSIVPFIIISGFILFMFNKMGGQGSNAKAFEFSKSRARLEGNIKVKFSDVAGADEEKVEMAEIIEYLKYPKKFAKMGARIPKGILLVGPPGTGKTLLAKAVAGEADVPFYSISGSDFVEMFVGVGASRVRDMFKKAQQTSPCMIFIDEIDAVGRQRGAGFGGGHDEREQTLNQLLVEMDGIQDNTGIVIIAATNRPDVLDPALLRPGRFDRQITVSLPDRRGRREILQVHARNKKLDTEIDLDALAKRTPGFSGADLENVLNEAAILAVREKSDVIHMSQLDESIDRVLMGPAKKSRTYDEKTKKLVAYHESGHAVIGLFLEDSTVVQKVTIIPRGMAGGYNLMTPKDEKMMNTKNDLLASITGYMGGRTAEEIFFDDISTGAVNDIERATNIARDMVTLYGMSDLGPIKYDAGNQNVFLGRDYNSPANVSGQIAFEIDQEIRKIIDGCHKHARTILEDHKDELIMLAEALMEYETLTAEQIERVVKGESIAEDFIKTNGNKEPVKEEKKVEEVKETAEIKEEVKVEETKEAKDDK